MLKKILNRFPNISPVWIAPVLALAVAGTLIWQNTVNKGPLVTLTMQYADGLEAGKTVVKYRSVNVGVVESVNLSKDLRRTEAKIRMNPGTEPLLHKDSVFWVVAPRMSAGRVSGLETLLSGPYLGLKAGISKESSNTFELSLIEPREGTRTAGREFILKSNSKRNRLREGDPITFHDVEIGQVLHITYDLEHNRAFHEIQIYGPYVHLVDSSAVFYAYGGIDLNVGPQGIELNVDSLEQMLRGGICMERYKQLERLPVLDEHLFTLYPDAKQAAFSVTQVYPAYVFFLHKRLDNLSVHSRVLLNGIEVGEVTDVAWYEDENNIFLEGPIPVRFTIRKGDLRFVRELMQTKLREGKVSVTLGSSSILRKNDVVNITLLSESAITSDGLETYRDLPVIPSLSSDALISSLEKTLMKIGEMDFRKIGKSLDNFLESTGALTRELAKTTSTANRQKTVERLNNAIDAFTQTLAVVQDGTERDSRISLLIDDLRATLRALLPAIQDLQQKPNSLIFGETVEDPIPQPTH